MTSRNLDVRRRLPRGPFATDGRVVKSHHYTLSLFLPLRVWTAKDTLTLRGPQGGRSCAGAVELHLRGSRARAPACGGEQRPQEAGRGGGRLPRDSLALCRTGRRDPPYWGLSRRFLAAAARSGWRWRPWPGFGRSRLRRGPQVWGVNEPLTLVFSPPTPSTFRGWTRPGRGPETAVAAAAAAAAGCSPRSRTGTWRSLPKRCWTPRRTR